MMVADLFYSEEQVAEALGWTIATLRKNRSIGKNHPPFKKLGKKVLFPRIDFKKWLDAKETHHEKTA